jgi:hypothetical protein
MGGQWFNDMFGHPDTTSVDLLTDVALKSLRQHLHITDDPADCNITIHKVMWCTSYCTSAIRYTETYIKYRL